MKLVLIPCPISENTASAVLPADVSKYALLCKHYLVENVRTARRFISELKLGINIDELTFEILVKEYDLKLSYKGKNFANTKNNVPFAVLPNNSFNLKTKGVINIKQSQVAILPFVQDVLAKKPINVEVTGFVKVKFLGINYSLNFNNESFQYSADLLKDVGLSKQVNKFKENNQALAKFFGIK